MSLTLIENKLARLRRHIRVMFVAWGFAKVMIWAAALILWLFYTDYMLHLPGGLRVAFLVAAVLILLVVAFRSIVYPLSRTLSDEDLALLVEREYPLLNERLISSLQILRSNERYKDVASEQMIRAVVGESFDIAGRLQFNEAVRSRRLLYMVLGSLGMMVLLFGHAWFARDPMSTWLKRAAGAGPEWPKRTQLQVEVLARDELSKYPTRDELVVNFTFNPEARIDQFGAVGVYEVAGGSDLRIIATPSGEKPREAELRITSYTINEDGTYVQRGDEIRRPMEYHGEDGGKDGEQARVYFSNNKTGLINPLEKLVVRCGDAISPPLWIRVIPAPELDSPITLGLTFPEYLALPAETTQELAIDAIAGTRVDYSFRTTKPLRLQGADASALFIDNSAGASERFAINTALDQGDNWYRVSLPALRVGMNRWRLKLVDDRGIENSKQIGDLMQVRQDTPPAVRVLFSGDPLVSNQFVYVTPDAVLPIEFQAEDDYGISVIRLFWRLNSADDFTEYAAFAAQPEIVALSRSPLRQGTWTYPLEFEKLLAGAKLVEGLPNTVEVYIQAFDMNQTVGDEGAERQGSRNHTTMTFELHSLDDLSIKVSSQIRNIKSTIFSMSDLQKAQLLLVEEAIAQPSLLDFTGEKGERLRHDLDEVYKRQNQLLRDCEVVLARFGVFAQVYQYNRLERADLARPQEARIQSVRMLAALAVSDREQQQALNVTLLRLENASNQEFNQYSLAVVNELKRMLARATPDASFSATSFGGLLQQQGVTSAGCFDRARTLLEGVLDYNAKPSDRLLMLQELAKQQEMAQALINAIIDQVKKWEGFDEILQLFRSLLKSQEETNTDVNKENR